MANPARAGTLAGLGNRTVQEERERQDQLMRRIEDEDLVPAWCWTPLTETMGKLTALADDLAWVATAYLSAVVVSGSKMFTRTAHQLAMEHTEVRASLPCRCGRSVPADQPHMVGRVEVLVATCQACGLTSVQYDGVPYGGPTLVSQGRAVH